MRTSRGALLACLVGAACGACTGSAGTPDGATDATTSEVAPDVALPDAIAVDAADASMSMACDAGAGPATLPQVTASWVVIGGDAGGVLPMPSGGDPTGTWEVTHVTVYVAPAQAMQFDPTTSTVTGTAWANFTATTYGLAFALEVTLDTTVAGIIHRGVQQQSYGTYTESNGTLMLTPTCFATANGANGTLGFSLDAPDRGRLFVGGGSTMGTFVMDLTRAP